MTIEPNSAEARQEPQGDIPDAGTSRASVDDLPAVDVVSIAPAKPVVERHGLSPTVGFVGGALLALVGVVSLVLAGSGLVKPAAAPAAPPPPPGVPIVSPTVVTPADLAHGRSIGDATAPVKVEVWEDFQCPVCARWNATVKQQLISTYIRPGKVQLAYRDFIVIGRESIVAAVAARIADREGKFWPFADSLFANQIGENAGSFAPSRLLAIASSLGMDWQRFETSLFVESEDPATIKVLQDNQDEGSKAGITGTPSIVVNGTLVPKNDWASISAAIDKALGTSSSGSATPSASSSSASPTVLPTPSPSAAG